jgi:hypothetical protein
MKRSEKKELCKEKIPYLYKEYKDNKVLQLKIYEYEKEYYILLNKNKYMLPEIEERLSKFEWEKLIINKEKVKVSIRCQALKDKQHSGTEQCGKQAKRNHLFCALHMPSTKKRTKEVIEKEVKTYRKYGLIKPSEVKALKKELQEVEDLPLETLQLFDEEIKIVLALLKKVLKDAEKDKTYRLTNSLTGRDGIITRLVELKKVQFELTHSPKVVFTKDQVEYMFLKFKMALIEVIKDKEVIQKLSDKFRLIGLEAKQKWEI